MKKTTTLLLLLTSTLFFAQNKIENIIIITTDGFRWQEVFKGIDSSIVEMPQFNQNKKTEIYKHYAATSEEESRKKILPFLWSTIQQNGQIYGNRKYGNNVDVANPFKISFPGYSEIFTGFVDTAINSNKFGNNPNTNVLSFLNTQKACNNKVAAFGAWFAFDRILNEQKSNIPVCCAFDTYPVKKDSITSLINTMKQNSYKPFDNEEALDIFTHTEAMYYLKTQKPKVLYISYGETDEWAHEGKYYDYLNAAHQVDQWIKEIWEYIQNTPQYKDKTALFITVDHGRGDKNKTQWTSHNAKIEDAHEIWFAVMGPTIVPKGEVKVKQQIYQKQFAQTFAELMGFTFNCEHPVEKSISSILIK